MQEALLIENQFIHAEITRINLEAAGYDVDHQLNAQDGHLFNFN